MTGESSASHTKKGLRYAVPSAGVRWSAVEGSPPAPRASQPQLADLQPPSHTDAQLLPLLPPPGFSGHLGGAQCPAVSFLKSQLPRCHGAHQGSLGCQQVPASGLLLPGRSCQPQFLLPFPPTAPVEAPLPVLLEPVPGLLSVSLHAAAPFKKHELHCIVSLLRALL